MKPLTVEDVLYFWSCSILGAPKRVRPRNLDTRSFNEKSLGANIGQCTRAVEGVIGYNRDLTLKWVDSRALSHSEVVRLRDFERELGQSLTSNPLFPIFEENATERPPRPSMTLEQAAKKIGFTRNALSVKLHRMPTALPYGSCKTSEGWKIYEEDLEVLRQD